MRLKAGNDAPRSVLSVTLPLVGFDTIYHTDMYQYDWTFFLELTNRLISSIMFVEFNRVHLNCGIITINLAAMKYKIDISNIKINLRRCVK